MPRIAAVTTATPEHLLRQTSVVEFAKSIYQKNKLFGRLLPVFENAAVEKRHLAVDFDWLSHKHSFTESNDLYIETSLKLAKKVTLELAHKCGIATRDFDAVFFISTTGLSTPSIEGRLSNLIELNPHIKRIPIWGLGCAGGAASLARAFDYVKAHPTHRALIIAVELCSLSFQLEDPRKTDIIAAALFGDGAAACAVYGDEVPRGQGAEPAILGSLSTIYPDSTDVMSWRVTADGFKVQLSQDIPTIVHKLVKPNIEELLQAHDLSLTNLRHFIFHPGGTKVLKAYADGLELAPEAFAHSREVLREFGNMSSVTVFFVLERYLKQFSLPSEDFGLIAALGPGFSSELVLLRWN